MDRELDKKRSRWVLGGLVLAVVVCGLGSRQFADPLPNFVADHAGDALWTVAVFLTLALVRPKSSPLGLFAGALAISGVVEFSQLIDLDWLARIRSTTVGRLLLGVGFVWLDLVRYFVGAATAAVVDLMVAKLRTNRREPLPGHGQ